MEQNDKAGVEETSKLADKQDWNSDNLNGEKIWSANARLTMNVAHKMAHNTKHNRDQHYLNTW